MPLCPAASPRLDIIAIQGLSQQQVDAVGRSRHEQSEQKSRERDNDAE
jgi:hypothetical protein